MMLIATLEITLRIPWANSLKDKRMVVKSVCQKLRDKFGVSVAEVAEQDIHRTAVIGVACVGSETAALDSVLDHLLCWMEEHCTAEVAEVQRQIL